MPPTDKAGYKAGKQVWIAMDVAATEMYDAKTGKVKIKGFYDDVVPLSDADRAALSALDGDLLILGAAGTACGQTAGSSEPVRDVTTTRPTLAKSRPRESLPRLSLCVNSRAGQAPNQAMMATARTPRPQAAFLSARFCFSVLPDFLLLD